MKIVQVLPDLKGGGAERVALNLAHQWSEMGHDVSFVLMQHRGDLCSLLHPRIEVYDLHASRIRQIPFGLISFFKKVRPHVTLAHMWPLTSAVVLAWRLTGSPGRLFLCEHTCLSEHVCRDLSIRLSLVKATLRISYPLASGVVSVSRGAASDLAQLTLLPETSIRVIYNPIVSAHLQPRIEPSAVTRKRLWQGSFSKTLISIGSLKESKNFNLLLDSFAELADELDAGLVILGEGTQRCALEKRIRELGLQQRVRLPGFHPTPDIWLRAADLFVLSSDYEGFGNVVVEALAAGTPVVSTICPYGPDEILEQGTHGVLVPVGDRAALVRGIRWALSRSWDWAALQRRALDFSIPRQASAYLKLFTLS